MRSTLMQDTGGRDLTPEELKEHEQALDMDNLDIEPYGEEEYEDDSSSRRY